MKSLNILIVEDEPSFRFALKLKLEKFGKIFEAADTTNARNIANGFPIEIAFVDLNLETKLDGLDLIEDLINKRIYCIILSGSEDEETIVKAYEKGCSDYYVKGKNLNNLDEIVEKYILSKGNVDFEKFLSEEYITQDTHTMGQLSVLKDIRHNADPVLLLGPTGVGKTIIARKIHLLAKCEGEFVEINCAAIPENLLESELFGHVKGSFTGALANKDGLLLKADKGIIFLDEIGALPLSLQAKLLKALEDKSFTPVGATKPVTSDFRIISATCEDLDEYRKNGQFRNDLYYRISGTNITLKGLSDRPQDINYLITYFLKASDRKIILTKEARELMNKYSWPGNVRELKKVINILLSKQKGIVTVEDLPTFTTTAKTGKCLEGTLMTTEIKNMAIQIGLYETMEMLKNEIMKSVSQDNNGKVNKTIQDLKISTNTYYKLVKSENNTSLTLN